MEGAQFRMHEYKALLIVFPWDFAFNQSTLQMETSSLAKDTSTAHPSAQYENHRRKHKFQPISGISSRSDCLDKTCQLWKTPYSDCRWSVKPCPSGPWPDYWSFSVMWQYQLSFNQCLPPGPAQAFASRCHYNYGSGRYDVHLFVMPKISGAVPIIELWSRGGFFSWRFRVACLWFRWGHWDFLCFWIQQHYRYPDSLEGRRPFISLLAFWSWFRLWELSCVDTGSFPFIGFIPW
jgi:hypothetical protein